MSDVKFSAFKTFLQNQMPNVMVLFGKDDYLKKNAVELVKKQLNLQFVDLNFCRIEEFDVDRIVDECNTVPFVDLKRLVVCSLPEKITQIDRLKKYCERANELSVLILIAGDDKPKLEMCTFVDCNMLDAKTLFNWVQVTAKKQNIVFEQSAIENLIDRTNMQKYSFHTKASDSS